MKITKKQEEDNGFDLKSAIESIGISQREFAKLTKYNFAHINKICNGLKCTEKTANDIIKAFNKYMNPNNLKVGDVIEIEQAWEDEQGNYHDENPTILEIKENGELKLDFGRKDINKFLSSAEFFAKDYSK